MAKRRDWIAIYELLQQCFIHFACHFRVTAQQRKQLYILLGTSESGARKVDWCFGQMQGYQQCGLGKDIQGLFDLTAWKALRREVKRNAEKQWARQNLPMQAPSVPTA